MSPLRLLPAAAWLGLSFLGAVKATEVAPTGEFRISSPEFAVGGALPPESGGSHGNLSPELSISGVPGNAKSVALIVEDPDALSGLFTHWLVWNLPPETTLISPGHAGSIQLPAGTEQGKNSFGQTGYDGPEPPSGTHRYFFRLYALDRVLPLGEGADRNALLAAMKGHIVAKAVLMGTYSAGK